jgi:hypothetical protein
MDKLHKPVTVCTVCRKPGPPGQTVEAVNRGCATVYIEAGKQERCRGIMRAAIGEHDWAECPGCDATGRETTTSKRCSICDGMGWIFATFLALVSEFEGPADRIHAQS